VFILEPFKKELAVNKAPIGLVNIDLTILYFFGFILEYCNCIIMYLQIFTSISQFDYFCDMSPHTSSIISFQAFIQYAAEELLTPIELLKYETPFRGLPNWSSLNALLLISKINEVTGVFISSNDLAALNTIGNIHELILAKMDGTK
jgi:acyl carrier protein